MSETPKESGTIRMLVAVHRQNFDGAAALNAVIVLAFDGAPREAGFALGDDLTMGEGDFGDGGDSPAEFHHDDSPDATGLWVVEWEWQMREDEEMDDTYPAYGVDRWSRPTFGDLAAFGMLPEPANV